MIVKAEGDDMGRRAHLAVRAKPSRSGPQGVEANMIHLGGVGCGALWLLMQGFNREGDQTAIAPCGLPAVAGLAVDERGVYVPLGARGTISRRISDGLAT